MQELEVLVAKAKGTEVEAWNFGPRTGIGGLVCLDWDWEFLAYRGQNILVKRAKTLTIRTPNMGYRMLYTTREKENSSPFKRHLHMEFENGGYAAVGGYAEDCEGNKQPYTKSTNAEIKTDNTIIADTKSFLNEQLERYAFLSYKCVNSIVDKKHIRLDHFQRLAIGQFMVSKDFLDDEIHDFFKTIFQADSKRDYDYSKTQAQISSARGFHERGGRPYPCTAKTNPENGRISTPLFQIFGFDHEKCGGCLRKQNVKDDHKHVKEHELEEILEHLRLEFTFKTPTDLRDLFFYQDGIYKPAECMIEGLLEKELGAKASVHFVSEVLEHLRHGSYVERCEFNKYTGSVPVLNGLLDLTSLELKPFDPKIIYTYKLNVRFDPAAKCSKWMAFLDQVLPQEDQPLLQEYLGYCILPAMPKHKLMWFYGLGRNGKGRIIITLEAIIGKQNCSYLELEEFDGEHRFATAQLYGKMMNVSSEPSTVNVLQTPLLKKITGEDTLDAEVKGKQKRLSFSNIAKPFVLGNQFPKVSDSSLAFEDRTLILKFPNTFTGKNQIDNIERSWLDESAEVSGIFNWMLEGLHRLGVNHDFTLSKTTKEIILEFKRTSDPIGAWIEDNCIFDVEGFVSRKAAFEDYKNYADQELGKTPETERRFYQRLRDTPKIKDHDSNREGRGFKGIRLRNPDDTIPQEGQTQLVSTAVTTVTTHNSKCQKNLSSASGNICDDKKPAVAAVVAVVTDKTNNENLSKIIEPLTSRDPIHYHMLPPNEPHPCNMYGCAREAKYKFGNNYYCDDKAISHFKELARKCREEGFELIEDLQQHDEYSTEVV
jgi:P4 family phage/plasmid primase-like protien